MLQKASEEYGLSSQCMSLVAVIKREGDTEGKLPETRVIPVGMPEDTAFESYFAPPAVMNCMAPLPQRVSTSRHGAIHFQKSAFGHRDIDVLCQEEEIGIDSAPLESGDALIDLAALLEPDGGMPGDDWEERLLASLLALLAFHAEGHTLDRGPFAPHMNRLAAFLKQAGLSSLTNDQQDIVTRLLDAIEGKRAVPEIDTSLTADSILHGTVSPEKAWSRLKAKMV